MGYLKSVDGVGGGKSNGNGGGGASSEEKQSGFSSSLSALGAKALALQGSGIKGRSGGSKGKAWPADRIDNSIKCPLITLLIGPLCRASQASGF
ncbi:hypothetical protein TKK_0018897 [Trichogramma kaykai]